MEGQNVIIIKKKKGGHAAAHGGGWKVAYADFMTAMMAFFLLMWLLSMVAPEKRARLATYFKHFSVFEKGGTTMLELRDGPGLVSIIDNADKVSKSSQYEESEEAAAEAEALIWHAVEDSLRAEIEKKLADLKDNIMVNTMEGGVRIDIMDKEKGTMFPSGGSELTPEGKRILSTLANSISGLQGKIAVEGHTDAKNYTSGSYTNWELSTERALTARRELERGGLRGDRIARVSGFSSTNPIIKNDIFDARNRRISLLIMGSNKTQSGVPGEEAARAPQPSDKLILKGFEFKTELPANN